MSKPRVSVEAIVAAAVSHGDESGDAAYAVGDLEGVLYRAWMKLSPKARIELGEEYRDFVESHGEIVEEECCRAGVRVTQNDNTSPAIERCDSCDLFASDDDAAEYVDKLLAKAALEHVDKLLREGES